jgi:hypothetical protein
MNYTFNDENLKCFTEAFNLLNQLEIKGFSNINILGNSVALFQKFLEGVKKEEDVTVKES